MNRAIEVGEAEGGAHRSVVFRIAQSTRRHSTLWVGVLYVLMIVVVLAVVAKLH